MNEQKSRYDFAKNEKMEFTKFITSYFDKIKGKFFTKDAQSAAFPS